MQEYGLNKDWYIVQDVKDCGEKAGIFKSDWNPTKAFAQVISEWELIDHLAHLQVLLAEQPYYGRELRGFNNAPWWYKNEFEVSEEMKDQSATLRFEGVDYYCKIWLNDQLLGEHEGYFAPFEFEVADLINFGGKNTLVAKVWSPWDESIVSLRVGNQSMDMNVHEMMKGTYEHSDGFFQRDVNPVGIWGDVKLLFYPGVRVCGNPFIETQLSENMSMAQVHVSVPVLVNVDDKNVTVRCKIIDESTGVEEASAECSKDLQPFVSTLELDIPVSDPKLWNTWDRGLPNLYTAKLEVWSDGICVQNVDCKFGIRKIEITRTEEETTFVLNGKKIYARGTSYFPDVYISKLNKEKYSRDLMAIKESGCNVVRVHVHVAKPEFYELCDEMGIAVIQDSDLNWVHPDSEEFKDRAVKIFTDMIKMLRNHPSIICWICMNEPDIWMIAIERGLVKEFDPMPTSMMNEIPGPQLVEALKKLDSTRPYIKGSRYQNDPESGDSHNYIGSLSGAQTHYTDIFGSTEKLNTEFGFDAPACKENLMAFPEIYKRLRSLINKENGIETIQYYQYRLLKYFIEHYRIMKYNPCSGYFQFLFTDICPQSFYGVYDWWGLPKLGLKALEESNQPMGVFMEYKDKPLAIWVVNDLLESFTDCSVEWVVSDDNGARIVSGNRKIDIGEDCAIRVCDFTFEVDEMTVYNVNLFVRDKNGKLLVKNTYKNAFQHPAHPEGHPTDMTHELGMRVFGA